MSMFLRIGLVPTVLLGLHVGAVAAFADETRISQGRLTAERLCIGCHALTGTGRIFAEKYVPSFSEIAKLPDRSAERLKAFITVPHRPMPGFLLPESEVVDVVAYIRSL